MLPFSPGTNKNVLKRNLLIVFLLLFLLFWFVPILWGRNNVPPRTYFGKGILRGSYSEAQKEIEKEAGAYEQGSVKVLFQGKKIDATLENIGLRIDRDKTLEGLKNAFREDSFSLKYFAKWWTSLIWGFRTPAYYSFDAAKLEALTGRSFNVTLASFQEAGLQAINDKIVLVPAKEGGSIDGAIVVAQILRNLKNWDNGDIEIKPKKVSPGVSTEEANRLKQELDGLLNYPFTFQVLDRTFKLPRSTVLSWIDIQKIEKQDSARTSDGEDMNNMINVVLSGQNFLNCQKGYGLEWDIDRNKLKAFLDQEIRSSVYRKPINGALTFENGNVQETASSQSELTLDVDSAAETVAQSFKKGEHLVSLPVKENPAPLSLQKVKELGVDSLLGTGESNFIGSPNNRKHNISVGASKFNGVVIGKGEEFSFLTTLGPVDKSTGYLPELVIKQDKTVPEFGGGMCQVSTTAFRAAVNSGLRVTERQNHAYPVQYYSPQGTDATVYIPHPDLKFVNDTPAPILVQTRITGNVLTFEYFGKSDGRRVELQDPRVWDKKPDGSMKAEWIQKVFDKSGNPMFQKNFLSKYESPSKYPHPGDEKQPTDKKKKKKKH